MIKIHVLRVGSTQVDEALPFSNKSKNKLAFTGIFRGKKHQITVPVTSYLIEHPKGLILVDTGWDTEIRTHPLKYEGIANYFASPGKLPANEAVSEQLEKLGYQSSDIDYVILTNMDIDHVGGIWLVKDAKHILASQKELLAASKFNPRYLRRLYKNIRIKTFPNTEYDLFDDGSVILLPLPGHSEGMTGIKITGDWNKFVVIAGDCGYGRDSYEKLILPGITWNKKAELAFLKKLQNLALDKSCQYVYLTHDEEQYQHKEVIL